MYLLVDESVGKYFAGLAAFKAKARAGLMGTFFCRSQKWG
jgi:hypothetical protein